MSAVIVVGGQLLSTSTGYLISTSMIEGGALGGFVGARSHGSKPLIPGGKGWSRVSHFPPSRSEGLALFSIQRD